MYIGTAVDRVNDRRQPFGPGERALLVRYQILSDLDQRMGEAVDDGVLVHGVAAQRAVIGFVVADDEVLVLRQHVYQRPRHAVVEVPQDADVPRTLDSLHGRGEGMY